MIESTACAGVSSEPVQADSDAGLIIRNFLSLVGGRGIAQALNFITNAYLARHIAVSGYGAVVLAQAVMSYLGTLTDSGLSVIAVREGARNPGNLQRIIAGITGTRLMLSAALGPIGLLLASILPLSESSRQVLRVYSVTLPLQAIAVDWVFRALQRMQAVAIVQVFGAVATSLLTITFIHRQEDVLRVPILTAATALMSAVLSVQLLRRYGFRLRAVFSADVARHYLKPALPLCASALATSLYGEMNSLIVGFVHGESAAGLYSAGWRLSAAFGVSVMLYYSAMAPAMMRAYDVSQDAAETMLHHSVRWTATVAGGIAVIAVCTGSVMVRLAFGPAFSGATPVFAIMLWAFGVGSVAHNWAQLAIAAHREGLVLRAVIAGGVVNLVVVGALVGRLGPVAGGIGNLLAELTVACVLILPWPRRLGVGALGQAAIPVLLCGVSALLAEFALPSGIAVAATVAVVAYLSGLIATRSITMLDVMGLRAALLGRRF